FFLFSSKVECNIILPCESPVEVIIEAKSFNVIATAVSSGITINGSNIPSSSSQFLASGDVIIIGGKITLKFEFNDIVFKRVDGNNIIVSDNLPNFIKQNDNGLFATSLPMDGLLPDDIVDKMDDTIHEIQSETMINVVTTMKPLLEDVIVGKLANWRHETFHRRIPDVHPNTLVSMGRHGLNNADFKEETIDQLVDQLRALYPLSPYTYVYGVLMPTILKWMVMSIFQVFSDEAEFYLQSGGKKTTQKIAMESFSRQMKTRRESQFQAGAIPSQILVGDVNSSQVGTSQTSATGTDVILQNVVGIDVNNSLDSTKNASTSTDPSQNVRAQQDVAVPNTTKKRQKRPCPVCKAPLTGLPRHMRDVHEW
uniref:FHA domain-containing protein n=1 Tax=Clytia hemisphaerica TaxID=252671 RepID=A0A7M5U483_9CNID